MQPLPVLSPAEISDDDLRNWPLSHLREVLIEMGKQCNVRCTMCYQTDFSPATRAAEVIWKERIMPALEVAETLSISGGEPTVLPGAKELLMTIRNDYRHLKLNVVTNGLLFRGIWEEAFLEQGYSVNFSLNAIDPSLYARVVQFGRQGDVLSNIRRLIERRNASGSKLRVRISTVIMDETIHEMADFIQWAADNGLDEALLYANYLYGIRKYKPSEVRQFLEAAYDAKDKNPQLSVILLEDFDRVYAQQHKTTPVRQRPVESRAANPCTIAFDNVSINFDGFVMPCCKSWYTFGNLIESDFMAVWRSEAAFRFRKRMLNMDFRDCHVACDLNARPSDSRIADVRKAISLIRRNPRSAISKGLRRIGLTTAQIDIPESKKPNALVQSSSATTAQNENDK